MPWIEVETLLPNPDDPPMCWIWQGTQHAVRSERGSSGRCQSSGDRCEVCFGRDFRVRFELPTALSWHMEQTGRPAPPDCADPYYEECDDQGDCDCDSCVGMDEDRSDSDRDGVYGYSYVPPTLVFKGETDLEMPRRGRGGYPAAPTSETYLGLEIEFEAISGSLRNMVEHAHESDLGWCKHDGSLSHGAEFATFPMTYQRVAASSLAQTIEVMRALGARAWQPGSCGLHIHVSTKAFAGRAHMWRFAAAHERMNAQLKRLAGRHSRNWAKWADDVRDPRRDERRALAMERDNIQWPGSWTSHAIDEARRGGSHPAVATKIIADKAFYSDRYLAVNYDPDHSTIELRFWKGSMWPGQILGACAIEDGLVEWTRHMPFAQVRDGLTWQAFTEWAAVNLPESQINHIAILATRRNVARHALPTISVERVENACV